MSDELNPIERDLLDGFNEFVERLKQENQADQARQVRELLYGKPFVINANAEIAAAGSGIHDIDAVMDDVCNFLDRMCHDRQWGVLDAVCRAWPTGCNPRSLQLTIGVLTATLAAKQHIPGRAVLLESAKLTWGDRPEYWGGLE